MSAKPGLVSVTRIRRRPTVLYPVRAATRTTSGGERPITVRWARENEIVIANFGASRPFEAAGDSAAPAPTRFTMRQIDPVGPAPLRDRLKRFQAKLT